MNRSRLKLSLGTAFLSALLSISFGCAESNPTGGAECATIADCPPGEVCVDGSCLPVCGADIDCAPTQTCRDSICVEVEDPDCTSNGDCMSPAMCEESGGDCIAGQCRYRELPAGSPCDDGDACTNDTTCTTWRTCEGLAVTCLSPPDYECTHNDSVLMAYGTPGVCDSTTGQCTYPVIESPCPNCAAACLGLCDNVTCDDTDPCTIDTCIAGSCNTAPYTGGCDDGDPCTHDDSCASGSCAGNSDLACPDGLLHFAAHSTFAPYPTTGGSATLNIGSYHPAREIWCLLVGTTTNQFSGMGSTTVSIGNVALTQTTLTPAGLDVGAPASYSGWFGRMASYRLPASAQGAAELSEQSSATFTVSAADVADTYRLIVWSYYPPPGASFQGVKGNHTTDSDGVTTRTISPAMVVPADIPLINNSVRSAASILVLAVSAATRSTGASSMSSTSLFGGVALAQDDGVGATIAGSAHIPDYVPIGAAETWDALTVSHPGANGVALHVLTATYW